MIILTWQAIDVQSSKKWKQHGNLCSDRSGQGALVAFQYNDNIGSFISIAFSINRQCMLALHCICHCLSPFLHWVFLLEAKVGVWLYMYQRSLHGKLKSWHWAVLRPGHKSIDLCAWIQIKEYCSSMLKWIALCTFYAQYHRCWPTILMMLTPSNLW